MEYLPNFCFGILSLINLLFSFGLLEYNTEHPPFFNRVGRLSVFN